MSPRILTESSNDPRRYRRLAEASWRWILDQVRWSDGPWIPDNVVVDSASADPKPSEYRDGFHSGIGGLAHVLAEIRLLRPWTDHESDLAAAIATWLRRRIPELVEPSFFDGLASTIGAFIALDEPGSEAAVRRLFDTMDADGWPSPPLSPKVYLPGARLNDATEGTASVLLAAVFASRHKVPRARDLADGAADVLLAASEPQAIGRNWRYVSPRFTVKPSEEMPNWSHGLAGIAGTLALAGVELDRPDLVEAAREGAEHLVTLGDTSGLGFVVPLSIPPADPAKVNPISYGWCHGPTGTSMLFLALDRAGVADVSGQPPLGWYGRCRRSVRSSGLPDRVRPGFWDNDGRCCGTAGVGDAFLDAWARNGDDADLAFATRLGDALVDRAVERDDYAYWRFLEHRASEPLLPPGVGWMQGAAGIAAYLFRRARVIDGVQPRVAAARMENWWALPDGRTPWHSPP